MWIVIVAPVTLVASATAADEDDGLAFQVIHPPRSAMPCFNPGMGLYVAGGDGLNHRPAPKDAWFWEIADIIYFRATWNDVQPSPGTEGFDAYFEPLFDAYVKKLGKRVAFRVMSEAMHSPHKYATPKWVFDQGVPSVVHRGLHIEDQLDPVFWDDRYVEAACRFARKLADYLDGREGLEWVEVGAIGEWGEMHLARHIPGRWTPDQLEVQRRVHLRGNITARLAVHHRWRNEGVAPCYDSLALDWFVLDEQGRELGHQRLFPATPTTLWKPGEMVEETVRLDLPGDLKAQKLILAVAVVDPERGGSPWQLGIEERDREGRYRVATIEAVPVAPIDTVVHHETFDAPDGLWGEAQGMQTALDPHVGHDSPPAMRVRGRQRGDYNLARWKLKSPLLPGSRYRLTAWLRVTSLDGTCRGPYLKVAVVDGKGQWLTNYNTNRYDLDRLAQWQSLSVVFETSTEVCAGQLAIEKGGRDLAIETDLHLDDIQLELLAAS